MTDLAAAKMGTKRVFPLLMSMSLPPVLSMLIQSLYNIVDSMFVAQVSDEAYLAVLYAFPIQNLILSLACLLYTSGPRVTASAAAAVQPCKNTDRSRLSRVTLPKRTVFSPASLSGMTR